MKARLSPLPLILSFFAVLAPLSAQADPTAELQVKGSIRPPGCTPTLSAGGTADYGVIPMKSLNQNATTSLGSKTVSFSLNCTAKIKVALAANDNRKSSVIAGAPSGSYGLGASAGKNIGYYSISLQNVTGDGSSVSTLWYSSGTTIEYGAPDGTSWTSTIPGGWSAGGPNIGLGRLAFTSSGTAPAAYQTISGSFVIQATIDRAVNLPSSQEIPLDGSATVEVQYL